MFFALCSLRIKGLFFILLCVSFLGTAAGEECMLNASFLHLPCNEVGTTWTLHCRALEGWVAVASMNLSWRARFLRFSTPQSFPLSSYSPIVALSHFLWESREAGEVLTGGCLYRFFLMAWPRLTPFCSGPVLSHPACSQNLGFLAFLDEVMSFLQAPE